MKIRRIPLAIVLLLSSACSNNVNKVDLPESSTQHAASAPANQQWFCQGARSGQWQCADLASIERPLRNQTDNENSTPVAAAPVTRKIEADTATTQITTPVMPVASTDSNPPTLPTPEQPSNANRPAFIDYPPHYVAVQLIAAHNAATLSLYQQQRPLLQTQQISVMRDQQQWYILLLGVYASVAEARQAINAVEDSLDESPWIRPISSLQNHLLP